MSYVIFDQEKEFTCPCGCGKTLKLSIQNTEACGWNAFVFSGKDCIVAVGEDNVGSEKDE